MLDISILSISVQRSFYKKLITNYKNKNLCVLKRRGIGASSLRDIELGVVYNSVSASLHSAPHIPHQSYATHSYVGERY